MDLYKRMGMYFFVVGAMLSILAGAFPLSGEMYNIVVVILIFLGVFSALLNITEDEEIGFIAAAMGFMIAIVSFQLLLGDNPLVAGLARFFEVATLFVGSMLGVVAIKTVVEFGSQNYHGKPLQEVEDVNEYADNYLWTKAQRKWNFFVFIAVAVSFVVILLDVFFGLEEYKQLFFIIDIGVTIIFFIDLIILYKNERSFGSFIKNCWLDIIATIPFYNVLRIAKIVRLIRLQRFVKLHKTMKFFSQKSGVKHYIRGGTKPLPPADSLCDTRENAHMPKRNTRHIKARTKVRPKAKKKR